MEWRMLLAPVLGGVIGYLTNDLAIRMLFRPRRGVYIGKWRLPFTPGLIPRQKARIAASIGAVVSRELLNEETLRRTFLSEGVLAAVRSKLDEIGENWRQEEAPLRDKLSGYAGEERVSHYEEVLRERGAAYLSQKLTEGDAGGVIVRTALQSLREKQGMGLLTALIDESAAQRLGDRLNRAIAQHGPELLGREIARLEDGVLRQPVGELYAKYEDKADPLKERVMALYVYLVEQKLTQALAVVNVEQMVADKINAFSAEELERMIFDVMKNELRAIVYLGALLGFLMGFLNLLL